MTDISLQRCPICQAGPVEVERKEGIIVADCGCMLTELQVRRLAGASKQEVASL
ncbi:hypothetical protein [Halobacterium sp. CBA1126]|uniref:hypothetical protein n=1 Tax=Halobacterium TaxID=2239 RepID=UPI0012F7CEB8|nr:hypothetical protein [Halobacterium sp. CBA1126]MUV59809.1 hypothetical protein [Halobacterium sp. CBA1126]